MGSYCLCFVNTYLADEILPIIARQRRVAVTAFTTAAADQYEEYRAAVVNGELENVFNLGQPLVPAVLDQEVLDAVIPSIVDHNQPDQADIQPMPAAALHDQELSPEDALAIQRALEGESAAIPNQELSPEDALAIQLAIEHFYL